jgi:DNA-binding NarL/FixJ family response regulator
MFVSVFDASGAATAQPAEEPAFQPPAATILFAKEHTMVVGRGSALIADDDEFFRAALSAILTKQLGFSKVFEAASLDEGLEQLGTKEGISAAFFDLSMPGVQSPANLKAVRECFPAMRIAVVSGSKRRQDILLALEAGVHGYVPKGIGIKDLTAALRTILEGAIYVPPGLADLPANSEESTDLPRPGNSSDNGGAASGLTARQRDVLELLVQGKSNKEIARSLALGEGTVKVHVAALFRNLGVNTRAGAAAAGVRLL